MKMKRSYFGKISVLLTVILIALSAVGITIFASAAETNPKNQTTTPVNSISSTEDLQKFADSVNTGGLTYEGQEVVLQNDITWKCKWESIEQFNGTFDGQGHTISGLTDAFITNVDLTGKVENLNIRSEITISYSDEYVPKDFGGIADINYGIISGCTFGGTITEPKSVHCPLNSCGGITGTNYGHIQNCSTTSNTKFTLSFSEGNIGGIAGKCIINSENIENQPSVGIYNSTNNANIKIDTKPRANFEGIGGICGNLTVSVYTEQLKQLDPQIQNCTNNGDLISTTSALGGICGRSNKGKIADCQNNGNITSTTEFVGGIVGLSTGVGAYAENINDSTDVIYIKRCINKGNITGDDYAGGIAGYSGQYFRQFSKVKRVSIMTIEDCINIGNIKTTSCGGGIVGYNQVIIKRCYNTGNVYGNWIEEMYSSISIGGIVGENANEISYCFNIGEVKVDVDEPLQYSIYSGGLVGLQTIGDNSEAPEFELSGKLVCCYNSGPVTGNYNSSTSETEYLVYYGGLVGEGAKESVENCTFNKDSAGDAVRAIGSYIGEDSDLGLEASEMVGEAAKENMPYLFEDGVFEILDDVAIDDVSYLSLPVIVGIESPYALVSDKMIAIASFPYVKIIVNEKVITPKGEETEEYCLGNVEIGEDFAFWFDFSEEENMYNIEEAVIIVNGEVITPNDEGYYLLTNLQTNTIIYATFKFSEKVPAPNVPAQNENAERNLNSNAANNTIEQVKSPNTGDVAIISFVVLFFINAAIIAFIRFKTRKTTL